MAVIAPQIDNEDEQNQQGMNILSPAGTQGAQITPQQPAQGQDQAQPQSFTTSGTQSASVGSTGPTQPSSMQQANRPKKGVGSGVYKDIRKYIDANKPATGRLAQGVVGGVQQQVKQGQQQLRGTQSQFQQGLQQQQQNIQGARQFALQQLQEAGTADLTPEDIQRFTALRTGEEQFQMEAPDWTQEQAKEQQLQRQAAEAGTEQGRFNLLKQAFQTPTYSRGQSALDQLLLQGTREGRETVQQGTDEAARGFQKDLTQARTAAIEDLGRLDEENIAMRDFIGEQATGARTGLVSDVDKQLAAERERLIGSQERLEQALAQGTFTPEMAQEFIDPQAFSEFQRQQQQQADYLDAILRGDTGAGGSARAATELLGQISSGDILAQQGWLDQVAATSGDPLYRDAATRLNQALRGFDMNYQDLAKLSAAINLSQDPNAYRQRGMGPAGDMYIEQAQATPVLQEFGLTTPEAIQQFQQQGGVSGYIQRQMAQRPQTLEQFAQMIPQAGVDLTGLISGRVDPSTVTRASVASPEQLARYQALAQLGGVEDLEILPERRAALPEQGAMFDLGRFAELRAGRLGQERLGDRTFTYGT
jgi:hypothetical protein